jgi:hypothetical protein
MSESPLLPYNAVSDPDTPQYHQAIKEHDLKTFYEGVTKEINDHFHIGSFTVIHKMFKEGMTK